jgi:hypothetical protein
LRSLSFIAEVEQGEIQAFDLAEPLLLLSARSPGEQIRFQDIETWQHLRVDLEHAASDTGMLVLTRGAVGPATGPELEASLVEV